MVETVEERGNTAIFNPNMAEADIFFFLFYRAFYFFWLCLSGTFETGLALLSFGDDCSFYCWYGVVLGLGLKAFWLFENVGSAVSSGLVLNSYQAPINLKYLSSAHLHLA